MYITNIVTITSYTKHNSSVDMKNIEIMKLKYKLEKIIIHKE